MKFLWWVGVLAVLFISIPIGLTIFHASPVLLTDMNWQYVFLGLFLLPVIAAFAAVLLIAAHPTSFHYRADFLAAAAVDPLVHAAVGSLVAVLQDVSAGYVAEPLVYTPEFLLVLERELLQLRLYRDRGFRFQYGFYHGEPYTASVRHRVSATEVIMEISGLFDYYFERNGTQSRAPHEFDTAAPFVHSPAIARLRVLYSQGDQRWQLAGFWENITAATLGLPTQ